MRFAFTAIRDSLTRSVIVRASVCMVLAIGASACGRADAAPQSGRDSSTAVAARVATKALLPTTQQMSTPSDTVADSILIAKADKGRLLGRDAGTIWLVVISDFQCPYCKTWHDSSMAQLKRDYIDPGKVRLAYLNLPLQMHPQARVEAEAALCAAAQAKFWSFSDALFRDQAAIHKLTDATPYLDTLARTSQLDMDEYQRCKKSPSIRALIDSDIQQANRIGVRSTPSFLIGEFLVEGAVPYPDFRRAVDSALSVARNKRAH